jgi:hypothetical protein
MRRQGESHERRTRLVAHYKDRTMGCSVLKVLIVAIVMGSMLASCGGDNLTLPGNGATPTPSATPTPTA